MFLQHLIKERFQSCNLNELAKMLGYSSTKKLSQKIEQVVNSETLGLDRSHYDFHTRTSEFICDLCGALAIPTNLCNKIVDEIETELQSKKHAFKPRLFIETNFKRKNEPLFALAALEGRRYIPVDDLRDLALNDHLTSISRLIKAHYAEQAELEMWGRISQYVYFYDEKTIIIFSTSGKVIDIVEEYSISKATMRLK